jgi:hypothetical protein
VKGQPRAASYCCDGWTSDLVFGGSVCAKGGLSLFLSVTQGRLILPFAKYLSVSDLVCC